MPSQDWRSPGLTPDLISNLELEPIYFRTSAFSVVYPVYGLVSRPGTESFRTTTFSRVPYDGLCLGVASDERRTMVYKWCLCCAVLPVKDPGGIDVPVLGDSPLNNWNNTGVCSFRDVKQNVAATAKDCNLAIVGITANVPAPVEFCSASIEKMTVDCPGGLATTDDPFMMLVNLLARGSDRLEPC